MLEPVPAEAEAKADGEVKYDNSGRVYADMDTLIARELARIRQRILAKKAAQANGQAKSAAAGANGE
jgi:hypothetical protein